MEGGKKSAQIGLIHTIFFFVWEATASIAQSDAEALAWAWTNYIELALSVGA
jgi:hypothetical protein